MPFLVFLFGLIIGSFLAALTYRIPKRISIAKGRSFCPNCHKKITWYDNIPLISFLILAGRCRNCHKKISLRYPIIELSTGLTFLISFFLLPYVTETANILILIPFFVIVSLCIAIFVIDWEHQIIPDSLVFLGLGLIFSIFLITDFSEIWVFLLAGFLCSSFLFLIHLLTKGRGMGLGDVKLAIFLGTVLGPLSLIWIFVSFILGGIVGIILLLFGKARWKQRIAFGPFLIVGAFIAFFFGNNISLLFY